MRTDREDWNSLTLLLALAGLLFLALIIYSPEINSLYLDPSIFGALFIANAVAMLEHSREAGKIIGMNPIEVLKKK